MMITVAQPSDGNADLQPAERHRRGAQVPGGAAPQVHGGTALRPAESLAGQCSCSAPASHAGRGGCEGVQLKGVDTASEGSWKKIIVQIFLFFFCDRRRGGCEGVQLKGVDTASEGSWKKYYCPNLPLFFFWTGRVK